MSLIYRLNLQPTSNVSFILYIWGEVLLKRQEYFLVFLLEYLLLYLCWVMYVGKKNQHFMLDHALRKKIFIHKFDLQLFPRTMLALWLFFIHSITMVYLELIADIICYLYKMIRVFKYIRYCKKIFPTNMLSYIVTYNSSFTSIQI